MRALDGAEGGGSSVSSKLVEFDDGLGLGCERFGGIGGQKKTHLSAQRSG